MADTPPPDSPLNPADKFRLTEQLPPPAPTGWRSLVPVTIRHTRKGTRIHVDWRKTFLLLLSLAVIGWLGAACGAYLFLKYSREFTEVKFSHMLLMPWKTDEYRESRGEFLIRKGQDELKEQKYREAFYSLRVGLSLSPRNREGRMLLSQFYVAWQRPDLARRTLLDGLEFNFEDEEYIKALFSYLLQQQADFELIKIADGLIARAGTSAPLDERLRMIVSSKATGHFLRGNYDAAEDTIRMYRLTDRMDGKLLTLQIGWERGEQNLVLEKLDALTAEFPAVEQIHSLYATFLRESGREDELRRICLLRQIRFPERPRPRIDLLYILDKSGEKERIEEEIESILIDYPKNGEAMVALADFAANTGRPALAKRIYDYCKANQLPWEGPALMSVEAHIVAKDFQAALVAARQMQKENPEWGKRFTSVFNGLQAIANYGLNDTSSAQIFLNNFLNQAGMRADNLMAVSKRLISVGAKIQARQVLAQAVQGDALNQPALVGLIKLDTELRNSESLSENVRTLLTMRKPPRAVLISAYDELCSDFNLLSPGRAELLAELVKAIQTSTDRSMGL